MIPINSTATRLLFRVPVLVPAMEFRARIARVGGGDTALMDEVLLRLLRSTGGLTIGGVRTLLGLSAEQFEAFLNPLGAAELVAVNEFGAVSLTEAGRKLFENKGAAPRLREIRFSPEVVRIDQLSLQPCTWNRAERGYRGLPVEIDSVPDLSTLKARVQYVLETEVEYDALNLLRSGAYPLPEAKRRSRVAFVDEINDGRSLQHEMTATIGLDPRGASAITYDGLMFEDQRNAREALTGAIEEALKAEGAREEKQPDGEIFALLSSAGASGPERMTWLAISRYFAKDPIRDGENYFSCLGRPELIAHAQASAQLERVIRRLPLKRGEEARSAKWLVYICADAAFWGRGNAFRDYRALFYRRLREQDSECRTLLLMIGKDVQDEIERDDELAGSFDAAVSISTASPPFQGLDAVLIPNEFVQITLTARFDRRDVLPVPYCVACSREEWAMAATHYLIQPLLLERNLVTRGLDEQEARELLKAFIREAPVGPGGRPKLTLRRKN